MKGLRFLVVDDASFIRDMLKKNLRSCFPGCEVSDAANGRKAQTMVKMNRFDLILCDWEMPEMGGEEFLRWIRANEPTATMPFIMVTSRGEKDFIIKAVQAGVSDYIGKPFSPEIIAKKVTKVLKKAGKNVAEIKAPGAQGLAGESVDILTGGSAPAAPKPANKTSDSSMSALMGGAKPPAAAKSRPKPAVKSKPSTVARGQAEIHFPNFSAQCVINAITLQTMSGAIKRGEQLPAILEPVVISIVQNDGEDVARLNGFINSIQATENRIDAAILKIGIRFVDEDPVKLEQLSRYIGKL